MKSTLNKLFLSTAFFVGFFISVNAQTNNSLISDKSTIVNTSYGKIQGYLDGEIYTFKGIQYAEAERFMPPVKPKFFEDIRMCRVYGPKAPQNETLKMNNTSQSDYDFGFQFKLEPMDEERCLVLNVWTKQIHDGKKRPVFVWFHGGGFSSGSGIDLPSYEGKSLADKGDIVVVTVNHRLNILGYLDMSGLGGRYSESVNLGMQDLVKSLEWVKDNIANFGGDPNSVTIGGQSGGGGKVSTVMMMPSAKGLFHRAIVQSGSFTKYNTNENSKLYSQALLDELGLKINDIEGLKLVPYERLNEAVNKSANIVNATLKYVDKQHFGTRQGPVIDGKFVVSPGFDTEAPTISSEVPMIIGWNYNEFDFVNGKEDQMFKDAAIKQATIKKKQGVADVYIYMFNWKPIGNTLGACHGMELAFMFNNISLQSEMNGATKEAFNLSDKMSSAWISFIKNGNPNVKGLPKWDSYNEKTKPIMIFDNNSRMIYNK